MEYNKNKFTKVDDHKVLHKVKKQWVVMSMAMLALLGGGAVAHKVSAHADVTDQNNITLKNRLNQNLQQTGQSTQINHLQNQLTNNHTYRKPINDGQQITNAINQKANALHNRILNNATISNVNASCADNLDNQKDYKNMQTSSQAYHIPNAMDSPKVETDDPEISNHFSASDWIETPSDKYINSNQVHDWQYHTGNYEKNYSGVYEATNLKWKYSPSQNAIEFLKGNITFSNDGSGDIDDLVKSMNISAKSVKFGKNISAPAEMNGTENISNLVIQKMITGYIYIANNSALKNLSISNGIVTQNGGTYNNEGIDDNPSLKYLNLNNFDTSQMNNMAYMFSDNPSLQYLNLGNKFNTLNTTSMEEMFNNDTSLQYLNLGDKFNTSNVINMGYMFNNNSSLQHLNLGDKFNTSSVLNMRSMFNGEKSLSSLNLGKHFNTSNVINMGGMFSSDIFRTVGFSNLDDLNLGNHFSVKNCRYFGSAQQNTIGPSENPIYAGDAFIWEENSRAGFTKGMFADDKYLQSITLQDVNQYADASWIFKSDYNLSNINVGILKAPNITSQNSYSTNTQIPPQDIPPTIHFSNAVAKQQIPYSNYDALVLGKGNNVPNLTSLTLGTSDSIFRRDIDPVYSSNYNAPANKGYLFPSAGSGNNNNKYFHDQLDKLYTGLDGRNISGSSDNQPAEYYYFDRRWHYYHNFTDGTWYQINPKDNQLLTEANLQDGQPHPGTWFRNKGINMIAYVNEQGKTIKIAAADQTDGDTEANFKNYLDNQPAPVGYTIPDKSTDIIIRKQFTPNQRIPNLIGIVHVAPISTHGLEPIQAKFENSDGSINHIGTVNVKYSGNINSNVVIKSDSVPSDINKYHLQSMTPNSVTGILIPSTNSVNSNNFPSTLMWIGGSAPVAIYKYDPSYAGNIVLNYINQSGLPVDYSSSVNRSTDGIDDSTYGSDIINGNHRYGDELNVLNPHNKRPYSTYGYPNPDSDDYKVDRNGINSDYTFGINQQYVTVPLTGKPTLNPNNHSQSQSDGNNAVKINVFTKGHQGDYQQTYTTTVHLNGRIGSLMSLKPSDLLNSNSPFYYDNLKDDNSHQKLNLAHYVIGGSYSFKQYYLHGNGNQSATLYNTIDGRPTTSAEDPSPANVNFYYDASPDYSTGVKTVTVRYINQHNHQVGNSDMITPTPSDYGREINVTNSDSRLNSQNGKTAHGMNVPNGYRLVDDSDVDYRITDQPQEADLYVRGDQEQINNGSNNYALPIHIVAHVYKSDGTTLDKMTTIQDTVSDGQGHSKQFTSSVNQTFTPTLVGNVGDSDVISAANYQPQVNSDQQIVESIGTNKYTVRFKQPQQNQSDISVDGVSNPTSKGITFNYKIVDKPTAHQRNYIHYISCSDVDNRGDITTQPNHSAFKTQVSDASYSDQTFNDKYYRENVPKGYQFYKVYSVNGNTNDSQISGGLTQFGNGKSGPQSGPGEEYIEVIPNASPITFHYINQNGSDVKDVQVSGNGSDKSVNGESNYTSNFGRMIAANSNSENQEHANNPSMEYMNRYINQSDGGNSSQLGVPQGYQYNALTDNQGKSTTIGETQPVFSRDPQDVYIPVTGKTYNKVNVQLQQDFSDANHQKSANSDYTYTINNAQVGHNYTIYGFDLNTPNAAAGSGYTLNQSGHPFKVTVHINPDSSYSFLDPSNNSDGRAETSSNQGDVSGTISVNNISDIKDNKNKNEISFNGNGDPKNQNPPKASFWYHITDNASKPLTLVYINQAGQQVGCADKTQGTVGSDINVTDPDQGGEPLPADYTLDGGITPNKTSSDKPITSQNSNSKKDYSSDVTGNNQNTEYRFTDQPRTVYLHVTGNTHTTNITVYTIAKNSDGTTTFSHKVGNVSGSDGSLVNVSPETYNPNSSKYSVDYSKDSTQFVRLTRNQNGQVVATPNRIIFYYSNKTTDGAPITLRYINHKTGQEVGYTKVINGNLSDKVDVASSDPTNGDLAGEDVPAGYTVDTNSKDLPQSNLLSGNSDHPVYKFSNSPQMLNIPVNGVPKTLTYHIHVFKEGSDGTIQGPASDVALHITGNVGDTIHISPYVFTSSSAGSDIKSISDSKGQLNNYGPPVGYHAANTDLDKDIQINANGQLSPDSNTNYFYQQNYQAPRIGATRVHYITSDTSANRKNGDGHIDQVDGNEYVELDQESDHGIVSNDMMPDYLTSTFHPSVNGSLEYSDAVAPSGVIPIGDRINLQNITPDNKGDHISEVDVIDGLRNDAITVPGMRVRLIELPGTSNSIPKVKFINSKLSFPQINPGNMFDLTPYTDDLPETLNGYYDLAPNNKVLDSNGNVIDPSEYQWAFQDGIDNVYIKVTPHGNGGIQPIIIGSDGNMLNS